MSRRSSEKGWSPGTACGLRVKSSQTACVPGGFRGRWRDQRGWIRSRACVWHEKATGGPCERRWRRVPAVAVITWRESVFLALGIGRIDVGHDLHVGAGEVPWEFAASGTDTELVFGQVESSSPASSARPSEPKQFFDDAVTELFLPAPTYKGQKIYIESCKECHGGGQALAGSKTACMGNYHGE